MDGYVLLKDEVRAKHPKGVIGICSGNMGRYREFDACLYQTMAPAGTRIVWGIGADPTWNLNKIFREMRPGEEWVWMLGDDHVWPPDLLLRLLERNVDCVTPYCLRRSAPYWHVLHYGRDREYMRCNQDALKGYKGMHDITGMAIGNAGMLTRRNVIEGIPSPWFECGQTHPEVMGSDLSFCQKVADSGHKLFVDLDNPIGHVTHMSIWPHQYEDGTWGVDLRTAADVLGSGVVGEFPYPAGVK